MEEGSNVKVTMQDASDRLIGKAKSLCFWATLRLFSFFFFGKTSHTVYHKQDKVRCSLATLKHPSLTYKAMAETLDTFFRLCQAVNYPRPGVSGASDLLSDLQTHACMYVYPNETLHLVASYL